METIKKSYVSIKKAYGESKERMDAFESHMEDKLAEHEKLLSAKLAEMESRLEKKISNTIQVQMAAVDSFASMEQRIISKMSEMFLITMLKDKINADTVMDKLSSE